MDSHTYAKMAMDDFELINGCISSDKKSWDIFVERFSRLIYDSIIRTFKKYGAQINQDIMDDLHNDIFVFLIDNQCKVLKAFEGRNGCTLASYLRTITIRKTIDYWRKLKPTISIDQEEDSGEGKRQKFLKELAVFDNHESLEKEDMSQMVETLFQSFGEEERYFCQLCFMSDRAPEEIAIQMGISVDNFYVRKQRILKKLKEVARNKEIC